MFKLILKINNIKNKKINKLSFLPTKLKNKKKFFLNHQPKNKPKNIKNKDEKNIKNENDEFLKLLIPKYKTFIKRVE